ncbi:GNAT family N-acetyltransferase [Paenibacillus sp. FSL R7-0337]|uniref:GNAT family N-acetyltransferase n=1 Tax=unclassified Paenibacillus TaxID=185978 RepID=UPI00096F979C|nr:GNAT family N-acetyltransferase [Paenibacillus sp. FSL R7-0337]OMF91361.1 GNAT family N-acetyltransferase [Paenibacillus sp. FSL R7-0337]
MLHSEIIEIRATAPDDLDFVLAAEGAEANRRFVGQWNREQHAAALDDGDLRHLIVQDTTGERVGYVILAGLQDSNRTLCIKRIVIQAKGRGYGTMTLKLLIHWTFNHTDTHRLWLDVKDYNVRAQHIYEAAGFKKEGTLRDCIQTEGGFESLTIMSILRQEYTGNDSL